MVAMVLLGGCYGVAKWLICYGVSMWLLWCC